MSVMLNQIKKNAIVHLDNVTVADASPCKVVG